MKVRTQQNFNRKTRETVFGISIMPDGGRRYCKYPIGHQEYFEAQEERFHRECFGEIKTERGTLVQTNLFDK